MKINDLKKQLVRESKTFVPDVKNRVYASVGYKTKPRPQLNFRLKPALTFLVLLFLSLSLFMKPGVIANSYVIVEINPAFELEVDQNNKVVDINEFNTDAYFFLETLSLNNITLDEALVEIVNEAEKQGYLKNENTMAVTAVNKNKKTENHVNNLIKTTIENHKPGALKNDENIKEEAKQYNVSPGKMLIIKKAMEVDANLKIETAVNLEIKDLVAIINNIIKDKVGKFENQYRENLEKLDEDKNTYIEELEQRKDEFKKHLEEIDGLRSSGMSLNEILSRISEDFPEYEINDEIEEIDDLFNDLNEFYDEHFDFLKEIIEENYEKQKDAYKDKVNENSKNNKEDFGWDFEIESPLDKYKNRYSDDEKKVLRIINQLNVLMRNNFPGLNNKIENLHEEYLGLLDDVSVEFLNSELIIEFEENYNNYKNSQPSGNNHFGNK